MRNYELFSRLAAAQILDGQWPWYQSHLIDDQIVEVKKEQYRTWYHPNGLVTVFPTHHDSGGPYVVSGWPEGVQHLIFIGPPKNYIAITGTDSVRRYYVLPEYQTDNANWPIEKRQKLGVTLMPHPDLLYVPVNPIPDYEVRVSRKRKKDAWVKWDDFFEFADVMWDLLPRVLNESTLTDMLQKTRQWPLMHDHRDSWHPYLQWHKIQIQAGSDRNTLKGIVEQHIMKRDLPYEVTRVPVTKTSHTSHWDPELIKRLDEAGLLPKD